MKKGQLHHLQRLAHTRTKQAQFWTPQYSHKLKPCKIVPLVTFNVLIHHRSFATNQTSYESRQHIAHALLNNPYNVLGVDPKASAAEIKAAYTQKVKLYHPDVATTDKDQATKVFIQIKEAYKVIGNEELRKQFDDQLHHLQPKVSAEASTSPSQPTTTQPSGPFSWSDSFRNLRNLAVFEYREERRRQQAEFLTFQKYLKRFRNMVSVWLQALKLRKEGPRFRFELLDDCGRDGMGRYVSSDGRTWDEQSWQTFPLAFQLRESPSKKDSKSDWLLKMDVLDHHAHQLLGTLMISDDTVEFYTGHGHLFSVAKRAVFADEEVAYIYDQYQTHFATLQTAYEKKRGLWASLLASITSTQSSNFFKKYRQGVIDSHGITLALDGVASPFQNDFLWNQVVNNSEIFPVAKTEVSPLFPQRLGYYINVINMERKVHPGVLISAYGFSIANRILLKPNLPSFLK